MSSETSISWQVVENRVRELASLIWGVPCHPREIAGVKVDGVLELKPNHWILLEITENETLQKLREDLAKFDTVVPTLLAQRIFAECFFITADEPPESIPKSAQAKHVTACSVSTFSNRFFDFASYRTARQQKSFGSSFNPFTGEPDQLTYIPVFYSDEDDRKTYDVDSIARLLKNGKTVVLTGDYGTGKSRCIREVFGRLAATHNIRDKAPLAIDLRHTWGLQSADEILSRHLQQLGLSQFRDRVISSLDKGAFTLLLDGFDELGSQSWSDDATALRQLRRHALVGVRDLVRRVRQGILITGRKNYFNSTKELLELLGVSADDTILLNCHEEFSLEQFRDFMQAVLPGIKAPYWLPRRPLICQVIAEMEPEHRETIFHENGDRIGFWDQFLAMVSTRESWIRNEMNSEAVCAVLRGLARLTRTKPADYGPISPAEIYGQFRDVLHREPTAESAQILARLPGLGLVDADSPERQFVDRFLLDGLRADDACSIVDNKEYHICALTWKNPLGDLGQMIAARRSLSGGKRKEFIAMAARAARDGNSVLSLDLIGSILRSADDDETLEFPSISVSHGKMSICDLGVAKAKGLRIQESDIDTLLVDNVVETDVSLEKCIIHKVFGVSDKQGLPGWCHDCIAEYYQSVETTASIRRSHLSVQHQILCVFIRKTFFQKGSGRKEEALLRGLGQIDHGGYRKKILRLLLREKVLYTNEGDDGLVYHPQRSGAKRMATILAELNHSKDPIWTEVGSL